MVQIESRGGKGRGQCCLGSLMLVLLCWPLACLAQGLTTTKPIFLVVGRSQSRPAAWRDINRRRPIAERLTKVARPARWSWKVAGGAGDRARSAAVLTFGREAGRRNGYTPCLLGNGPTKSR